MLDQLRGEGDVGDLSFSDDQSQRATFRIHRQMQFGAQSVSRTSERLRPAFLRPRPNAGALARSSNRSGCARFPSRLPKHSPPAPAHPCFASASSGYIPYAIGRIPREDRATDCRFGQSIALHRGTNDCWMPFGHGRLPCPAG